MAGTANVTTAPAPPTNGFGEDTVIFACLAATCVAFHFLLTGIRAWINICPCDVHELYAIDDSFDAVGEETADMMTTSEGEAFSPPIPIGRMRHIEALLGACRWPATVIGCTAVGVWVLNQSKAFGESMTASMIRSTSAAGTSFTVSVMYSPWYQKALDVHAYLCFAILLWLITMLFIMKRIVRKQLELRALHRRLALDVTSQGSVAIQDADLFQFSSRQEWFIKTISHELPDVNESFDFARYQALCLDHALSRLREFKIRSVAASAVALSLLGLLDVVVWDFADIWRHVTVLVVMLAFALGIYLHVHNAEKDMNSMVGFSTEQQSSRIDEDAGSLPMVFVKASIVCSSYMVVRLYASKVLNAEEGPRTGSSTTTGEEAGIVAMHVVAFLLQCLIQSECVIVSTTVLSMPPRVHGKHFDIAVLVAGLGQHDKSDDDMRPVLSDERHLGQGDTYAWTVKPGTEVGNGEVESTWPRGDRATEPAKANAEAPDADGDELSTAKTPAENLGDEAGIEGDVPATAATPAPTVESSRPARPKFKDLLSRRIKMKNDASEGQPPDKKTLRRAAIKLLSDAAGQGPPAEPREAASLTASQQSAVPVVQL